MPVFYRRPATGAVGELRVVPAVASWDVAGSPGQVRSTAFLDDAATVVAGQVPPSAVPLAVRLDVGLPATVGLYGAHDLDNYLFPLVPTLAARTGRAFVSVWATKRHAPASHITAEIAVPAADPGGTIVADVTTTASAQTTAYKQQLRDQLAGTVPLPGDGIALQLAFVVGPARAWANLWKPTIDALGAILGRDEGAGEWNTRDGRITDLGLHCTIDPQAGHRVRIALRACTTTQP